MKGGIIVKKQEMTRLWDNGKMIPVTLVVVPHQVITRYKTTENDGYNAVIVGVPGKKSGTFSLLKEFPCSQEWMLEHPVGSPFIENKLVDGNTHTIVGISKGKGFQGVIKRHHFGGGPDTHGSKFHRAGGSTGNRKPRRTHKNHPMAGHMGSDKTTLKGIKIVSQYTIDTQHVVAFYGSLPGAYNTSLFVYL